MEMEEHRPLASMWRILSVYFLESYSTFRGPFVLCNMLRKKVIYKVS